MTTTGLGMRVAAVAVAVVSSLGVDHTSCRSHWKSTAPVAAVGSMTDAIAVEAIASFCPCYPRVIATLVKLVKLGGLAAQVT